MADIRASLRLFDEFLWVLRREGAPISTAETLDAMKVVRLLGIEDEGTLRMGLEAVLLQGHGNRDAFGRAWDQVFHRAAPPPTLRALLEAAGATADEVDAVLALLERSTEAYTYLLSQPGGGVELAHHLGTGALATLVREHRDAAREGATAHRLAAHTKLSEAKQLARRMGLELAETYGHARSELLVRALERAADLAMPELRRVLRAARDAAQARAREGGALRAPMETLSTDESAEVQRALAAFAERLHGRWRVRRRHARKGRVAIGATLRCAWRTGGVPMRLVRRPKQRKKPRLVLLCDVSESVRAHTRFTLEFVRATLDLFADARAFVFVADIREVSDVLRSEAPRSAVDQVLFAGLPATDNSNYGTAFSRFAARHREVLTRDTTLVILGDGRSNHNDPQAQVLSDLRASVKAVHWLCPESKERWGQGDSAIPSYAPHCTRVWEARNAEDVLLAARTLIG